MLFARTFIYIRRFRTVPCSISLLGWWGNVARCWRERSIRRRRRRACPCAAAAPGMLPAPCCCGTDVGSHDNGSIATSPAVVHACVDCHHRKRVAARCLRSCTACRHQQYVWHRRCSCKQCCCGERGNFGAGGYTRANAFVLLRSPLVAFFVLVRVEEAVAGRLATAAKAGRA